MNNTGCDNVLCVKRKVCYRFLLFKSGEQNFKTFTGNSKKGCSKFIKINK